MDGLLEQPFALDADGMLDVPAGPGLGVRLEPSKVRRYAGNIDGLFL